MTSEMWKEMKEMRIENQKIIEELSKINMKTKNDDLANLEKLNNLIDEIKERLEDPTFEKLYNLSFSKDAIQIGLFQTFKFHDETRKSEEYKDLNPTMFVLVGPEVVEQNVTDAVTKAIFKIFGEIANLKVEEFWSEIEIPFELKIHAEEVHISPKEGKHARYVDKVFEHVETVLVKDLDSISDISFDFIRNADNIELLPADHPRVSENFETICIKGMTLFFENDTSQCENFIRIWCSLFDQSEGAKLILVFSRIREDEAKNRIFNSLLHDGFVRISDEEMRRPTIDSGEVRLTFKEHAGAHFTEQFYWNTCPPKMFTKLTVPQLAEHLPFFLANPKFALFANAAKFEIERRLPNHPCDFYYQEELGLGQKYFYCFRHNRLPDKCRPILMIGSDTEVQESAIFCGLEILKNSEPSLQNIVLLVAVNDVAISARNYLSSHVDLRENFHTPCYNFYLPDTVFPKIIEKDQNFRLPDADFLLGSTRVEDVEIVNSTWKFASPEAILQQKEKIQRLPTACIFHKDRPVAFEMIGLHGQLSHQYTFPEYRNRGLGAIIENRIVSKCISEGIVPIKSVELSNEAVLRRSLEDPFWTVVKEKTGENVNFLYVEYI